jgi:hypothetical protein
MSVKLFIHRIEIDLWQAFITTLSESPTVQNSLPKIYDFFCKGRPYLILLAWACSGLAIGFGIGALRGYIQ